jgi:hypothetical protein
MSVVYGWETWCFKKGKTWVAGDWEEGAEECFDLGRGCKYRRKRTV